MNSNRTRLSRRQFLRQGAFLAASAALAQPAGPATIPIIDSHVHFYDPTRPGGVYWPPKDNAVLYSPHLPRQFAAVTKNFNLVGVVVIEAEARPDDNRWVLELAKSNPIIVGYIGRLTPGDPGFASNFEQYAQNPIFRGLRLTAEMMAHGGFEKGLRLLAERRLTLDLVGGPAILSRLGQLAKISPGLRMVIDHLPFHEWDGNIAALRNALGEAASMPNVFAKISDVARRVGGKLVTAPGYYRPALDALWDLFGEDRVIYGSNWPVSDLVAPYASVLKIVDEFVKGRGTAATEKFFWKNSLEAYQWQPRGAAARLPR